jgi:hypothetical protein
MKNNQPFLLRFTNGPMNSRQFTLIPGQTYVMGSHPDTEIRIDGDPTVSRRHAAICLHTNGKLAITDLNSTNGTRINGKRIKQEGRLREGDGLQLGLNSFCIVQTWSALESSLPPGISSGFELIKKADLQKSSAFSMTAPLWFTVAGFCIGGICFSLWQAYDAPNNVFARTVPAGTLLPSNEMSLDKPSNNPLRESNESNSNTDVPLVASHYVWDEIVNISQRFGEIPPSAMDPQFVAQVEHWINFYTKNNRHVELLRKRDLVWEKIQRILQIHGLPGELGYIAWVESAFDTQAVSHAGAVGMWQFIDSTAQEYGLIKISEKNPDARRQIEASTHAAARYLNSLLGQFGNKRYLLALAAYNAGQNRIKRQEISQSIKTSKQVDFWHLKETLPKETLDYVPKVLAAIIIGRNPENW